MRRTACPPQRLEPSTLSWLESLATIAAPILLLLMLLAMTSTLYPPVLQVQQRLQQIGNQIAHPMPR